METKRPTGTVNGAVGTTTNGAWVWGLDRGQGTERFQPAFGAGVKFDSVVALFANQTGSFIDLIAGTPPQALPGGSVHVKDAPENRFRMSALRYFFLPQRIWPVLRRYPQHPCCARMGGHLTEPNLREQDMPAAYLPRTDGLRLSEAAELLGADSAVVLLSLAT